MYIQSVTAEPLLEEIRIIFREYQDSLNVDLSFQEFEQELCSLPGKYTAPRGRLYLTFIDNHPAACIALRPFSDTECEMKRLYVRPEYRGHGLARALGKRIINDARTIGYSAMLLDTLSDMTAARRLYESLGFYYIDSYCFNPIPNACYMRLNLARDKSVEYDFCDTKYNNDF